MTDADTIRDGTLISSSFISFPMDLPIELGLPEAAYASSAHLSSSTGVSLLVHSLLKITSRVGVEWLPTIRTTAARSAVQRAGCTSYANSTRRAAKIWKICRFEAIRAGNPVACGSSLDIAVHSHVYVYSARFHLLGDGLFVLSPSAELLRSRMPRPSPSWQLERLRSPPSSAAFVHENSPSSSTTSTTSTTSTSLILASNMQRSAGPLSPSLSSYGDLYSFHSASGRPYQDSPPGSNHPSGSTDTSRPSASSVGRPPSSASSIARSADGRSQYGPPPPHPHSDESLRRHYATLKTYLQSTLQDEKGNMRPNRARDKLLRLSVHQFMELSTDVYDELIRREDDRLRRIPHVPPCLLPKPTFHPKRNQARQKLSTLPIERFKQLATDVFFELERRIPRFGPDGGDRPRSSASNGPGGRLPPPGYRGPPPPHLGGRGMPPGMGLPPPEFGRPMPKTFQSNTIVPNKGTMVEDDDYDDDYGSVMDGRFSKVTRVVSNSVEDQEKIQAQEAQINQLQSRVGDLEQQVEQARVEGEGEWQKLRRELEQKHTDAQSLNDSLRQELDQLHRDKTQDERKIRLEHDSVVSDLRAQLDRLQQSEHHAHRSGPTDVQTARLRDELAVQQKLTAEVRTEATAYLREMRDLSQHNDAAIEREERLTQQVAALQRDVSDWRTRYAQLKSHSTVDLPPSSADGALSPDVLAPVDGGLVPDVDVTRFQLAVDELLRAARQPATPPMLAAVKTVVVCVRAITAAAGPDGYPSPSQSPVTPDAKAPGLDKLQARVTGTANSLITATKHHASAAGLSPVALLDAAASNLTAAVVQLIRALGVRSTAAATSTKPPTALPSVAAALRLDVTSPGSPDASSLTSPGATGLGRSATLKKANGWFNWGRRDDDDSDDADAPAPVNGNVPRDAADEAEREAWR